MYIGLDLGLDRSKLRGPNLHGAREGSEMSSLSSYVARTVAMHIWNRLPRSTSLSLRNTNNEKSCRWGHRDDSHEDDSHEGGSYKDSSHEGGSYKDGSQEDSKPLHIRRYDSHKDRAVKAVPFQGNSDSNTR